MWRTGKASKNMGERVGHVVAIVTVYGHPIARVHIARTLYELVVIYVRPSYVPPGLPAAVGRSPSFSL